MAYQDTNNSGTNAFKEVEKQFRFRKTGPKPDMSGVIDFANAENDDRIERVPLPADSPFPPTAVASRIKGLEGFYHISNVLSAEEQVQLAKRCLVEFPDPPNDTNLRLHHGDIFSLWKTRRDMVKSLRWTTLGYLYQWTERKYDDSKRSPVPRQLIDLGQNVARIGNQKMTTEAVIVNYYYHDSTLSGHKDDSEETQQNPLITISLGCTAIFLLGGETKETPPHVMLVRGGDGIIMGGVARKGYHGVPRILGGTWGGEGAAFAPEDAEFVEYLKASRINLSLRQVHFDEGVPPLHMITGEGAEGGAGGNGNEEKKDRRDDSTLPPSKKGREGETETETVKENENENVVATDAMTHATNESSVSNYVSPRADLWGPDELLASLFRASFESWGGEGSFRVKSGVTSRIPRILHQIWLGSPFPAKFVAWRESWRRLHPDWEYRLWTDAEVAAETARRPLHNEYQYHRAANFGEKSDILRYEILYRYGGVYCDVDFECLRSFDELLTRSPPLNSFVGISLPPPPLEINNGIFGCVGHDSCQLMRRCIDAINDEEMAFVAQKMIESDTSHGMETIAKTGPGMFTFAVGEVLKREEERRRKGGKGGGEEEEEVEVAELVVFPREYFFPIDNSNNNKNEVKRDEIPSVSYCIHHWQRSWQKDNKEERDETNQENKNSSPAPPLSQQSILWLARRYQQSHQNR